MRWEAGPSAGLYAGGGFETVDAPWTLAGILEADAGRFPAPFVRGVRRLEPGRPRLVASGYSCGRRAYGGRFDEARPRAAGARLGALATLEANAQAHRIQLGGGRLSYLSGPPWSRWPPRPA